MRIHAHINVYILPHLKIQHFAGWYSIPQFKLNHSFQLEFVGFFVKAYFSQLSIRNKHVPSAVNIIFEIYVIEKAMMLQKLYDIIPSQVTQITTNPQCPFLHQSKCTLPFKFCLIEERCKLPEFYLEFQFFRSLMCQTWS